MLILHAHLNNCEQSLLAQSKIPGVAGHTLHKGTPIEVFIREFLSEHLPSDLGIGSGEVVDCTTMAGGKRNQNDIVVYKTSYPRISLGGGINAFLRESVAATIEVKSLLTEYELEKAISTAYKLKQLRSTALAWKPEIATYVVAYDGAAQMETVLGWIENIYRKLGHLDPADLRSMGARRVPSTALDGVYLLGVGACIFENNVGFLQGYFAQEFPEARWSILNREAGALFLMFAGLLGLSQGDLGNLDPYQYMRSFSPSHVQFAAIEASRRFWVSPLSPKPSNTEEQGQSLNDAGKTPSSGSE